MLHFGVLRPSTLLHFQILSLVGAVLLCRLPNGTLDGIRFLAGINYEWYIFDVPFRQLRMVHGTWPVGINYEWYTDMVHGTWLAGISSVEWHTDVVSFPCLAQPFWLWSDL